MTQGLIKIRRVLVSVTNKVGIDAFVKELQAINPLIEIIASGNTAATLIQAGCRLTLLSDYTGFPECFGGRVKTLHPKIEGGILFRRGEHDGEAERLNIPAIDLVVCNLYDFASARREANLPLSDLVEKVDIGGSTLIRSACKNFANVGIVVDPRDYLHVVTEMRELGGTLCLETRARLAGKAFNYSADYEAEVATEFSSRLLGENTLRPKLVHGRTLRYGENPDQKGWVYEFENEQGIAQAKIVNGKQLSYNNYEDATAAYQSMVELANLKATYGVSIIKHGGLCGYASGTSLVDSFKKAWAGDPKSAFGGVIAFTCEVTEELIQDLQHKFVEILIAPKFSEGFIAWAAENKRSLRLLEVPVIVGEHLVFKKISGGMLVQTSKRPQHVESAKPLLKPVSPQAKRKIGVVTEKVPPASREGLVNFGLAAVKYAKSNALALVREAPSGGYQLLGMGAGQPNRVDSLVRLAIPKAVENLRREHGGEESYDPCQDLKNCCLISDGFFPFADSIKEAADAGIGFCVQPGGSVRDKEVIDEANKQEMCMIFSGERNFSH